MFSVLFLFFSFGVFARRYRYNSDFYQVENVPQYLSNYQEENYQNYQKENENYQVENVQENYFENSNDDDKYFENSRIPNYQANGAKHAAHQAGIPFHLFKLFIS